MVRTVGGTTSPPNSSVATWLAILISFSIASNVFISNYNNNNSSALKALTDPSFSLPPVPNTNTSEARELKELRASHSLMERLVQNLTKYIDSLKGQLIEQTKDVQFLKSEHKRHHSILKVHLWDDTCPEYGRREKQFFNVEGWSTHPRTRLVDSPEDADIVVWVSVRSNTEREVPPRNYSNVVLLDYADGCGPMHQKEKELKHLVGYFRRSFVSRDQDSIYTGNCTDGRSDIYPLAYSGISALINRDLTKERKVLITNVLRTAGSHNTVRARILDWTKIFVEKHNLQNVSVLNNVGWGYSASDWDMNFQAHLENCKIIVTCNPWSWEGDFRLWEALSSGAMVMVDRMAIPNFMPHPFVHKKHLVYYDPRNQTEFEELLEYYVKNQEEARRIGEAGYQFVLDHHMPKDRVEYILSNIEDRLVL